MSAFKNPNFVKEFAYRTMINYYHGRMDYSKTEEEKNKYEKFASNVEGQMSNYKNNFSIAPFYEVTALINSLIGLLVFPEQNVYRFIDDTEEGLKKQFNTLYRLTLNEKSYENTYDKDGRGKATPKQIFAHMKNALSHNRVMIFPESPYPSEEIKSITFNDNDEPQGKDHHFKITIPITELESVIMDISNYLITIKP